MGKLIDQSCWEVQLSADILAYYANNAEKFLATQEVASKQAVVITKPIGVILAIELWNFPYY
jgi:succinate-semialdehyde dehydrogenase/glutarate-semialdehyde dehydrogenase